MKIKNLLLFLMLSGCTLNALGQQVRRFSAGMLAGLSAAQIDGDNLWGYDKLGLQAGVQVNTALGKRSEASLGFAFCQRGSQSKLIPTGGEPYFRVTLNYVEVPLTLSYKDWWVSDRDNDQRGFFKVSFDGGVSYGRLISVNFNDDYDDQINREQFRNNDVSMILGCTFSPSRRWSFLFRYNRSLTYIWDPKNFNPTFKHNWNGHFLSFLSRFNF